MVRAPCCEKMGLKKGPWTPEEDQILISYVQKNGHGNWRALPKQAGLLRCGKSCRLRWINYLRPDIKRGNFTKEEEETIIHLHEMLGNRWSAIAAKLPGRTDNEIKNVWHTHLKKRLLKPNQPNSGTKKCRKGAIKRSDSISSRITDQSETARPRFNNLPEMDTTSEGTSSDFSSVTVQENNKKKLAVTIKSEDIECLEEIVPKIDESFWSEAAINETPTTNTMSSTSMTISNEFLPFQYQFNPTESFQHGNPNSNFEDDGMDFWYDVFIRTESSMELPEFLGF